MIVVSEASPLINLAIIGYFHLLKELYGTIILPGAVFNELTVKGKGRPGAQEAREADWIIVEECDMLEMASELQKELDPGESKAIALAVHLNADLLLIDTTTMPFPAHSIKHGSSRIFAEFPERCSARANSGRADTTPHRRRILS